MLERITPEETLKQGDIVYIQGDKQHIAAFHKVVG
jgi:K+/H+ antiporter YhaU regulatory subunit KhtT